MSKRVIFVCSLLLIAGLGAAWNMLVALTRRDIQFNFGILLIPISIGLFLGRAVARTLASILFCVGYVFLLVMLGAAVAGAKITTTLPFPASLPLVFVFVALAGSVMSLIHWMLYSSPFDEHLN